jgi:rhodanese-related sulfurtransferase
MPQLHAPARASADASPALHAGCPTEARELPAILQAAEARAREEGLPFAGSLTPQEAFDLFSQHAAILIDVRTAEERKFVGHVPDSGHVAWMTGISLTRNPRFAKELEAKARKDEPILLLCRSGKRSAAAAEVATKAGFAHVFNVREGFEGDLDERNQRGGHNGWRFAGLPWIQD